MYLVFAEIIIETDFSKTKNLDKIYFTDVVSESSKFNTYETSSSAFIIVALLYYR